MTNPTPLSPAAQAVLDAVEDDCIHPTDLHHIAAAALRAAADQVVPDEPAPTGMRPAGDVYSSREIRPSSKPSPNSSQIGSSLVERVEGALMESIKEQGSMARAAIREVAAWMRSNPDHHFPPALVFALEHEAEI